MTQDEYQNAREQREHEERLADKRTEFRKWTIDKIFVSLPSLLKDIVMTLLMAASAYLSWGTGSLVQETAKESKEGRTEIAEKIDAGQKVAKEAVDEAKVAVNHAVTAAEETKAAVAEIKGGMPRPEPDP